jgi:hypothetical protein
MLHHVMRWQIYYKKSTMFIGMIKKFSLLQALEQELDWMHFPLLGKQLGMDMNQRQSPFLAEN